MRMKKILAIILCCMLTALSFTGCGGETSGTENEGTESVSGSDDTEYTHRVILTSDTHYMSNLSQSEYKALHPDSKPSAAFGDAFGYTQTEKMQAIVDDVTAFSQRETVDALFVLGDASTDNYGNDNLAENYVEMFRDDVLEKLPIDSYVLNGNHDAYPNEKWVEMFGYEKQFSVKIGNAAFICLDTYATGNAKSGGGADYSGVDTEWLSKELEKYPTEQIFLLSHYFKPSDYDYSLNKILRENERITCLFMGHSHANEILLPDGYDNRFLVNVYGYAYHSEEMSDGSWVFDYFKEEYAWGFGVLEWNDTQAHYYHVKYPRTYTGRNGVFEYPGSVQDKLTIEFKKEGE